MIELAGVRMDWGGGFGLSLPDWSLSAGAHGLVLGPSGSGKTTLLSLVAGLYRPTAGRITIDGRQIDSMSAASVDHFRGRRIGFVFQTLHLVGALTVADNIRLARRMAELPPDEDHIRGLLDALGIAALANRRPRQVSHGQAQRAAIARALATRPAIILADEPTSALDDDHAQQVIALLRTQARAANAALVVATHDRRVIDLFDQRLVLNRQAAGAAA